MFLNNSKWKILTPNGFEPFAGIQCKSSSVHLHLALSNGKTVVCTPDHLLFSNGKEIAAKTLRPNHKLDSVTGKVRVVSVVQTVDELPVFDIVGVPSRTFIASGLISHNCEFVSSDPLLIDSLKAAQLKTHEHKSQELGVKIWIDFEMQETQKYQQTPSAAQNFHNHWQNPEYHRPIEVMSYDKQCIVTVDPSKGVGKDYTVVEVFSYPDLTQMMELRSNKSKSGDIYIALKRIWEKAERAGWQVLFTVENNGVGEGLIALFENDESLPENVEMISEIGQIGLNTSAKSKAIGCKIFKEFVESGKLKLNSRDLVAEIKEFVLTGGTYKAKEGATDDCVMSTILVCRVVKQLAAFDDQAFEMLYSTEESEESKHEFDDEDGDDDYDVMPMLF